jgi:type IV pilus assembly protein PilA
MDPESAPGIVPEPAKAAGRKTPPWLIIVRTLLLVLAVIVVGFGVLMGLEKRRSKDKAVLGNAAQLSAAADQYFIEHGVSLVSYEKLVGATNYIKRLNLVDQEVYPRYFTQGSPITVTGIAGARTVTYVP